MHASSVMEDVGMLIECYFGRACNSNTIATAVAESSITGLKEGERTDVGLCVSIDAGVVGGVCAWTCWNGGDWRWGKGDGCGDVS